MAEITSAINVNVRAKTKQKATKILNELGINMSTAINMYLEQIVYYEGIPFMLSTKHPNRKLKKAIKEGKKIMEGKVEAKGYHNADELLEALESDD